MGKVVSHYSILAPILRCEGFRKAYSSRAGGCRVDEWERTDGERKIKVQIWEDGGHRVSHSINGTETTYPTEFSGPGDILDAIKREATRTDNRKLVERGA